MPDSIFWGSILTNLAKKHAVDARFKSWIGETETIDRLIAAATDQSPVTGLTHNFYRYPARFSPKLIREVIRTFTEPGDWIFDPFMGGGTSIVEALALGRHALGSDISTLASFISSVKTTLYSTKELALLSQWIGQIPTHINMHGKSASSSDWAERGYHKHLDHPSRWRLRKAIEQALESAITLKSTKLENFARCVVLRTAQWALDGRKESASVAEFRDMLVKSFCAMIEGAKALKQEAYKNSAKPGKTQTICLNRSTIGIENEKIVKKILAPRLVITSPPYPGVHVLYHRWQVAGGRETAAPFWIANKLDGAGGSYYTMGDRKAAELNVYFENLHAIFSSVRKLCDEATTIVQVVAFAEPEWQLPRYLETIEAAGYCETFLPIASEDRRLWRPVPNRKWYADQKGETGGSQEVVLFHRISS